MKHNSSNNQEKCLWHIVKWDYGNNVFYISFLQRKLKMTLEDAKEDNFTRFICDAVTPVWKLLFEKNILFWYILASSGIKQSKLQRAGPNRS